MDAFFNFLLIKKTFLYPFHKNQKPDLWQKDVFSHPGVFHTFKLFNSRPRLNENNPSFFTFKFVRYEYQDQFYGKPSGTERNGTERNGTERNGTERNGTRAFIQLFAALITFFFVHNLHGQPVPTHACKELICNPSFEKINGCNNASNFLWIRNGCSDCNVAVGGNPKVILTGTNTYPAAYEGSRFAALFMSYLKIYGPDHHDAPVHMVMANKLPAALVSGQPYTLSFHHAGKFYAPDNFPIFFNLRLGSGFTNNANSIDEYVECTLPDLSAFQAIETDIPTGASWAPYSINFIPNSDNQDQLIFEPCSPSMNKAVIQALLLDGLSLTCPTLMNVNFMASYLGDNNYEFMNNVTSGIAGLTAVSYLWDFGDGTTSTDPNPTHHYGNNGAYTVRLTITDNRGCCGTFFRDLDISGCQCSDVPYVIGGDNINGQVSETWTAANGTIALGQNVIVPPGRTLNITGAFVEVVSPCMFTVMRGGRMIVDNSILSNKCDGQLWAGIDVWGNPAVPHSPAMYSATGPNGPGYLHITGNSTLRRAHILIQDHKEYIGGSPSMVALDNKTAEIIAWTPGQTQLSPNNYRGGLINVENSNFSENRKVAEFHKYDFLNFSRFNLARIVNGPDTTYNNFEGVSIWDTDGITFNSCEFKEVKSNGITNLDGGMTVTGSTFAGNTSGIVLFAMSQMAPGTPIDIGAAGGANTFTSNKTGISVMASNKVKVRGNHFNLNNFGMDVSGSTEMTVTGNDFAGVASRTAQRFQSAGFPSKIQGCNTYTAVRGYDILGDNHGIDLNGEQFATGQWDIRIRRTATGELGDIMTQGSGTKPVFNQFSAHSNNIRSSTAAGQTVAFNYFHPNPAISAKKFRPVCDLGSPCPNAVNNFTNVKVDGNFTPPPCITLFAPENPDRCKTKPCLDSTKTRLNTIAGTYDGGSQANLLAAVSSMPSSQTTFDKLTAASPYLTDAVLIAVANASAMAAANREGYLKANAPLTDAVMAAAQNNVGTSTWNALVTARNSGNISARRTLEIEEDALKVKYETGMGDVIIAALNAKDWTLAESVLAGNSTNSAQKWLFTTKMAKSDFSSAQSVLNAYPSATQDDSWFKQVQQVHLDMLANPAVQYQLSPTNKTLLESVAQKPTSVGANARAIYYLLTRKFINFDEPQDEVVSLSSGPETPVWKKIPEIGEQLIAVAPNPADGFVELRIEAWQPNWNATLTLENSVGQVVFSKKLDAETTYVQTDGFPVGVYLVRLKDANGHQLSVQKLIVAH